MERFGEKLRTLRKQHRLSQTQLGDHLGVKQSYVGKMERGDKTPNVAMLLKIAELFNVSFDKLMNDDLRLD